MRPVALTLLPLPSSNSSAALVAIAMMFAMPALGQDPAQAPLLLQPIQQLAPFPRGESAQALPIVVRANEIRGRPDLETMAIGDAEFRRGGVVIRADQLRYENAEDLARASGNVRITSDGNTYRGSELQLYVQRFEGFFLNPTYFFSRIGASGSAERFEFIDSQRARALGATYTSCPADGSGDPDWLLTTSRLELDFDANEGVAEDAVLRFLGVPILGLPTLSFPLTDARKSGWLPPSLNLDNKSGLEYAMPYYWNIAPQRDATFMPGLATRRGGSLDSEYRWLESWHSGQASLHVLPNDRITGTSRSALRLQADADTPGGPLLRARVKQVSDDDYWKDFPRAVGSFTPRLLEQDIMARRDFRHASDELTLYGRVQRWQALDDVDPAARFDAPYQRAPQLGLRYAPALGAGFEGWFESEINRFTLRAVGTGLSRPTGMRWHAIGSLSRPWISAYGWFTPRLSFNAASYSLDQVLADGRASMSRVIPTLSVDTGLTFERDTSWFGRPVRQTLEPRVLYVNTPFREQLGLPNFDSAPKDLNFESIFSENVFSGVDRVSDGHGFTAGVTSRWTDPVNGAEVARLGLAQRYLLRDQQITPDAVPLTQRFSEVLVLGSTQVATRWWLDASIRYSPETDRVTRSVLNARFSPGPFRTISAGYRLARGSSEQVELAWQWPVYGRDRVASAASSSTSGACKGAWYSVGRINYSTPDARVTDAVVGIEYDAGCWIGRVVAERLSTGRSEATTRLLLQLELVGLSRLGSNPLQVLKDNIPGYRLLRDDKATRLNPSIHE